MVCYEFHYLSSEFAFGSLRDVLFRFSPLPPPLKKKEQSIPEWAKGKFKEKERGGGKEYQLWGEKS